MKKLIYEESTLRYKKKGKNLEYCFLYPGNLHWRCTRCGACCRDPEERERRILLLPTDIERLSRVSDQDFYEQVDGCKPFVAELEKVDGKCIFLKNNICQVYKDRALLCRTYPFWVEREGEAFKIMVDKKCPGLKYGEKLDEEFFQQLLEECLHHIGI